MQLKSIFHLFLTSRHGISNMDRIIDEILTKTGNEPADDIIDIDDAPDADLQKVLEESMKPGGNYQTNTSANSTDLDGMQKAIDESLKFNITNGKSWGNNELRDGNPVGLKNVGNTCFVNSLFQTYFTLPPLVNGVLSHDLSGSKCIFIEFLIL